MKFLNYIKEMYATSIASQTQDSNRQIINHSFPIYKNPSSDEIKSLRKECNQFFKNSYCRFIIDLEKKDFYFFSGELLHYEVIAKFNLYGRDYDKLIRGEAKILPNGKLSAVTPSFVTSLSTFKFCRNYFE
jgi:hypothetical protein